LRAAGTVTEHTADGRYIVVGGRRWRATHPLIPPERGAALRAALVGRAAGGQGHPGYRGRTPGPGRRPGGQGGAGRTRATVVGADRRRAEGALGDGRPAARPASRILTGQRAVAATRASTNAAMRTATRR